MNDNEAMNFCAQILKVFEKIISMSTSSEKKMKAKIWQKM